VNELKNDKKKILDFWTSLIESLVRNDFSLLLKGLLPSCLHFRNIGSFFAQKLSDRMCLKRMQILINALLYIAEIKVKFSISV